MSVLAPGQDMSSLHALRSEGQEGNAQVAGSPGGSGEAVQSLPGGPGEEDPGSVFGTQGHLFGSSFEATPEI